MLLELREHSENLFITLTYSDENLPAKSSLKKKHLQLFLKKLRKRLKSKIRYFAVGEYGDRKGRPHYHLILFGNGEIGASGQMSIERKKGRTVKTLHNSFIDKSWEKGLIDVQILENGDQGKKAARYVAGYCLKKLTTDESVSQVYPDRSPEFSIMSRGNPKNKPPFDKGIGMASAQRIATALRNYDISLSGTGRATQSDLTENIYMVRYDGKKWPIGRTLREKIINQLGGDTRTPHSKSINHNSKVIKGIIQYDEETEQKEITESHAKAYKVVRTKKESGYF